MPVDILLITLLQRVPIDVCQLFGPPTTFLQQAAHLTTGAYLHLTDRSSVLQYLIVRFCYTTPHHTTPYHTQRF
jgi:hypothetical protein